MAKASPNITENQSNVSIGRQIFLICVLLVVGGLILILLFPQFLIQSKPKRPIPLTINWTAIFEGYRCGIKKDLLDLYDKSMEKNIEYSILKKLQNIIETLDCSTLVEKEKPLSKLKEYDVCPEKYLGSDYGLQYGFKKGFLHENCYNVKSFSKVVTVLFEAVQSYYDNYTIVYIIKEIERHYPNLTVLLAVPLSMILNRNSSQMNVITMTFTHKNSAGFILNELLKKVETPYIYILRDIDDFTYHSRLKRLILVLSTYSKVAITGGAFRDPEGLWSANCFQTTFQNYYLHYESGYHRSLGECMFCDYFSGPFAAKTHILKTVQFNEHLPSDIIFEEFFFQIKNHSYLVFSCPDVMSFLKKDNIPIRRNSWIEFAILHEFNKIILPNSTALEFTCKEVKQNCAPFSTTKSYLMPFCCQSIIIERINTIVNYLDQHNITYYAIDGTLLGAVKLGFPLPWDLDSDILIEKETSHFLKDNHAIWTSRGFTSAQFSSVDATLAKFVDFRIRIYYSSLYFELFSTLGISDYTDEKYKSKPTKVKFGNIILNAPINPGLVSRNQFGKEVLKHSQSWYVLGQGLYSNYKAGSFLPCKKPWDIACLDHFPADGNIAFRTP